MYNRRRVILEVHSVGQPHTYASAGPARVTVPATLHLNPVNAKLNPICHLLALLGAHHILHVSRIRVKSYRTRYAPKRR